MCAALAVFVMAPTAGAQAATAWPWCAVLTIKDGLSINCGFASMRQCAATVDGIGGWCEPNPRYWNQARHGADRPHAR